MPGIFDPRFNRNRPFGLPPTTGPYNPNDLTGIGLQGGSIFPYPQQGGGAIIPGINSQVPRRVEGLLPAAESQNIPPSSSPTQARDAILAGQSPIRPPSEQWKFTKFNTPDTDAYRAALREKEPQRGDYQLGKWGKALSLAAGAAEGYTTGRPSAGIETGVGLLQRPYREAMEDWQTRAARMKELSGTELAERQYQTETEGKAKDIDFAEGEAKRRDLTTLQSLIEGDWKGKLTEAQIAEINDRVANGQKAEFHIDGVSWEWGPKTGLKRLGQVGELPSTTRAAKKADDIAVNAAQIEAQGRSQQAIDNNRAKIAANVPASIEDKARARTLAQAEIALEDPAIYATVFGPDGAILTTADPNASQGIQQRITRRNNQILGTEPIDPVTLDGKITDPAELEYRRRAMRALQRGRYVPRKDKDGKTIPGVDKQEIFIDKKAVDQMVEDQLKQGYAEPGSTSVPSSVGRPQPGMSPSEQIPAAGTPIVDTPDDVPNLPDRDFSPLGGIIPGVNRRRGVTPTPIFPYQPPSAVLGQTARNFADWNAAQARRSSRYNR